MKARFFQHVRLRFALLLAALITTAIVCGGGNLTFAQPSPQASPSVAQTNQSPEPERDSAVEQASPDATVENEKQSSSPEPAGARKPQREDYWIVAGLLVVLAGLFYLLIHYSSRVENSGYLGTIFRDSLRDFEISRLSSSYVQKWENYGYHEHAQRDPEVRQRIKAAEAAEAALRTTANTGLALGSGPPGTGRGPGRIGTGAGYHEEVEKQARRNYNADLDEARRKAEERAERVVKQVDLNVLRGRGPEFVLEFTAVVVLVFAVVILGLLLVLESQPIATLLAAIAGYVLGRASTRKGGEGETARAGISTAEVIQLVQAVSGSPKPAKAKPAENATEPAEEATEPSENTASNKPAKKPEVSAGSSAQQPADDTSAADETS